MGMMRFHKMHGLGNDFVVIDARMTPAEMTRNRAAAIANRNTGIGCDQLILLENSSIADVKMRIFNADGSEVEACGNATRCVALLMAKPASIETAGGLLQTTPGDAKAMVELEPPSFAWDSIPLSMPMDTAGMPVAWEMLDHPMAVNVGNPHVIFFVDDCDKIALDHIGPEIEQDPLFPERVNVNIATITGPNSLKLRVWERGAGLTLACGTGACATAVAAIKSGRVNSPVTVTLPGGDLEIAWVSGEPIFMTGPASHVFTGEANWSQFG